MAVFTTRVVARGDIESYVNKPVVLQDVAVGVIRNATEVDDEYELEILFFDRFIKIIGEFSYDELVSFEIKTK